MRKLGLAAAVAAVCCGGLVLLRGQGQGPDEPRAQARGDAPDDGSRFVLLAGGDINVGRRIGRAVTKHGFDWVFGAMKPYFEGADLVFGNLEMVFTTRFDSKRNKGGHKKAWHIHGNPEQVSTLHAMGVDVVSLANNHAFDYTCPGIEQTRKTLTEAGILFGGAGTDLEQAKTPVVTTVNGIKVGFIFFCAPCAATLAGPKRCGVRYLSTRRKAVASSIAAVAEQIQELRKSVDVVFVSPHWGRAFNTGTLDDSMKELGRGMIDAGADAILGHGNHIYLGVENYKGRPILYDMGNFLFDQSKFKAYRRQVLYRLEVSKRGVRSVELLPFELTKRAKSRLMDATVLDELFGRITRYNVNPGGTVIRSDDGRLFMDLSNPRAPALTQ